MLNFIEIVLDVVLLVALFGVTVFVHELGHFLAAIWSGMVVEVFSIGFGPAIWKKKVRGVVLKIGWIPFGGYVAIPQLDPTAMASVQGKDGQAAVPLPQVSPWKKILVSLAGVTGNVLLAILFAWIVYWSPNVITEEGNTIIGSVKAGSVADVAGMKPGDMIVAVNGERVRTWYEFAIICAFKGKKNPELALEVSRAGETSSISLPVVKGAHGISEIDGLEKSSLCAVAAVEKGGAAEAAGLQRGDVIRAINGVNIRSSEHMVNLVAGMDGLTVPVLISRKASEMSLQVTPRYNEELKRAVMGIKFGEVPSSPWMQYKRPGMQLKHDSWHIWRMLKALTSREEASGASDGLGGPPLIFMTLWFTVRSGWIYAMAFARFLNINLAILNLLPIPVLDGGHLLFALWEAITRRKPHPKVVNTLVNVFATMLLVLLLFLCVRDFVKMPGILRARKEAIAEVRDKAAPPKNTEAKDE